MDVLVLIGRILFSAIFLTSGYAHLARRQMMTAYATGKGVPLARLLVPATGVQIILGALMILLGIWQDLGALLLVIFLVPTAVLMHPFWKENDAQMQAVEQSQFMKDMALAGAALVMFAVFAGLGDDLGLVVAGPLFNFH
ncbi:DoxX family protein [Pseudarthrobacter oxydans]|uniref:DoxX family protein n=1 Tax=Pseudarthrobacter TaxID=1742993 RepID=UPI00074456A9|nr:DoxX family protein [Pseudarthrobacter sp. NCCP-2145]KUO26655.1 DoxX family protein [Vibrio cholerae]MBD1539583.1 DoxX family protein [Arthrobacter sp. S13_S34]GKV73748.1 membrane protein [Pseudarthrobacter sp. NCCP-2145]